MERNMTASDLSSANSPKSANGSMPPGTLSDHRSGVFISYSRVEEPFVRGLDRALVTDGMDVWVDWDDIRPSEDWVKRILSEIERIGTMLIVITPESCGSRVCNLEVNHAAQLGKRLIPILRRDVPRDALNEHLKNLHWIFFRDGDDPEKAMSSLQFALKADLDWIDEKARLLTKALEWDRGRRRWAATLRGQALRTAEQWLKRADNATRNPIPLHREFLVASRRASNQFRIIALVTSVVLVALVVLAPILWERSRARERETIDSQLQLDQNSSPSPLDLVRRSSLTQLLGRAHSSGHTDGAAEIERKLEQIPPPDSRVEVLGSDPSRVGLTTAGTGDRLFLWAPDRIEAYGPDDGKPVAVYRQRGGRILWVQGDPCANGVLFEVEFDSFADPTIAATVYPLQGRRFRKHVGEHDVEGEKEFISEVVGNERGIFFMSIAESEGSVPELLGLTKQFDELPLANNPRDGDRTGYVFFARPKKDMESRENLIQQRYARMELSTSLFKNEGNGLREGILDVFPDKLKVSPLAYAANGQAAVYEIAYPGVQRTGYMDAQLGKMTYEFILPMVRDGDDRVIKLARSTILCEHAKMYRDAAAFKKLNLTEVRPNFQPAALDMVRRQAVLRDRLIRFPEGRNDVTTIAIDLDWGAVANVRFTPEGQALILRYRDRGAGLYDLRTGRLVHRFPGPSPQVRDVAVGPDGRYVYLLEANGVLRRWDVAAFGPDGWASQSNPSNHLERVSGKTGFNRSPSKVPTVSIFSPKVELQLSDPTPIARMPSQAQSLSREEAEKIFKAIEEAGGKAEIK